MAPMPMIVPQQQTQPQPQVQTPLTPPKLDDIPSTSDILLTQTIEPEATLTTNTTSPIHQLTAAEAVSSMTNEQMMTNQQATNVPTAVNNTPLSSTMTETTAGCNSYSIELFDTPPPPPPTQAANTGNVYQQQQPQHMPTANTDGQQANETQQKQESMRQLLQQQYNQYYQNYQQHQSLMQNLKKSANDTLNTSREPTNNTSTFNSSILSGDDVSTIAETAEDYRPPPTATSASAASNTNANVPISHLLAGNEYPSLHKQPPTAIVQSFAPVYVQTAQQPQSGNDIYQEYVQNPYNLTLQQQTNATMSGQLVSVEQHQENLRQLQMQYQQQQQQAQAQQQQQQQQPTSHPHNHTEAFNSPANYFSSTVDRSL